MNNQSFSASVIIPVYNAERFIPSALESVLAHAEVKEIIIVDDASPDNSLSICKDFRSRDERVKIFHHPGNQNRGAGASRNLGLSLATQPYIAFLDADDRYTPERFAAEKVLFNAHNFFDGVYGATGSEYSDSIGCKAWEKLGLSARTITTVNHKIPADVLFEYLIGFKHLKKYNGYFHINALTLKRSSIMRHGLSFDESLRLHQDSAFIFQCAYHLKLASGLIDRNVSIRRIHQANRWIHNTNELETKAALYRSLMRWGIDSGIKRKYIHLFDYYTKRLEISDKPALVQNLFKAGWFIKHPEVLCEKILDKIR